MFRAAVLFPLGFPLVLNLILYLIASILAQEQHPSINGFTLIVLFLGTPRFVKKPLEVPNLFHPIFVLQATTRVT